MRTIAILLVTAVALMVIGCQPPEGLGGVSTEQFDELKTKVETLETNVADLQEALESLTDVYNGHIAKYHKGGKVAPKKEPAPVQK